MNDQPEELHEAIERRVLGPNWVGMILDDGRLVLIAHDKSVQLVLDAATSSNLLDLLSVHKTLLQQISQGQDQCKVRLRIQHTHSGLSLALGSPSSF